MDLWSRQVSERVIATISRMIDTEKEIEFKNNEEYLKRVQKADEFEKESKDRIKFKNDNDKYYINSRVTGYDGNSFRTKGFSIPRKEIPNMITGLQKIIDGEFDSKIKNALIESGIIEDTEEEIEQIPEEKENKEEDFEEWYGGLSDSEKKVFYYYFLIAQMKT